MIHSAAWHSQFRHPTPSVVALYAKTSAQQVVTGLRGAVSLRIDEHGISAPQFAREQQSHFWNAPAQALEIDLDAIDAPRRRAGRDG